MFVIWNESEKKSNAKRKQRRAAPKEKRDGGQEIFAEAQQNGIIAEQRPKSRSIICDFETSMPRIGIIFAFRLHYFRCDARQITHILWIADR